MWMCVVDVTPACYAVTANITYSFSFYWRGKQHVFSPLGQVLYKMWICFRQYYTFILLLMR